MFKVGMRRYFRYLGINMKFPPDCESIPEPVFREHHISYFVVYQTLINPWEYSTNVLKIISMTYHTFRHILP